MNEDNINVIDSIPITNTFRLQEIPLCHLCETRHYKMTYLFPDGYSSDGYKVAFCSIILAKKLAELVPEAIIKE